MEFIVDFSSKMDWLHISLPSNFRSPLPQFIEELSRAFDPKEDLTIIFYYKKERLPPRCTSVYQGSVYIWFNGKLSKVDLVNSYRKI